MDPKPAGLSPRSTVRGRPRTASTRDDPCARCSRNIPRLAKQWPEGRLCNICYFDAVHTWGTGPDCLQDRLLPGPSNAEGQPVCATCAEIPYDFHCERDIEAGHHRGRLCARCALRDDLHGPPPADSRQGNRRRFHGRPGPSFVLRNQRRTTLMLGLVRLHLNGTDNPRRYAELLRSWLTDNGGNAPAQRTGYDRGTSRRLPAGQRRAESLRT